MTENLRLKLEVDKTYKDWGSYNDGSAFDLAPVDSSSTDSSWYECGTTDNGNCAFNGNTAYNNTANQGFYSWYAATGGKGTYDSIGDINGSICPKGWKLPYNYSVSTVKSYSSLLSAYDMPITSVSVNYIATLEATPLSFSQPGHYNGGNLLYTGADGRYWMSTARDSASAHDFGYGPTYTYPQNFRTKYLGFSIRCFNI